MIATRGARGDSVPLRTHSRPWWCYTAPRMQQLPKISLPSRRCA